MVADARGLSRSTPWCSLIVSRSDRHRGGALSATNRTPSRNRGNRSRAIIYDEWVAATESPLAGFSASDRDAILGGNAARFDGLGSRQ
jgi:hypothetical protein